MRRWILGAVVIVLVATSATWLAVRPTAPADVEHTRFPLTLTDDEGAVVTLRLKPLRIVSIAPHFTETLFAIGAGDSVVAVGAGETHPPETTVMAAVVGPDGLTPSAEAIIATKPDLVLASGFPEAPWKEQVRAEVPLVTLEATGVDDALSDIAKVGRLVGRPETANALVKRMRRGLPAVRRGDRPRVVIETFPDPLQIAGTGGYLEDLVTKAGGRLVSTSDGQSVAVTVDAVISLDPRLYVLPTSSGTTEELASREGLASVPAVKEGRVIVIEDQLLFRPGPRLTQAVRRLNGAILPD